MAADNGAQTHRNQQSSKIIKTPGQLLLLGQHCVKEIVKPECTPSRKSGADFICSQVYGFIIEISDTSCYSHAHTYLATGQMDMQPNAQAYLHKAPDTMLWPFIKIAPNSCTRFVAKIKMHNISDKNDTMNSERQN